MTDMKELSWRKGKRVAIIGAGPGGVSAALGLLRQGYDVRIFEKSAEPKPLGGAVLLSVPVLAVLRYYGVDLDNFGSFTVTEFRNHKGKLRAKLPFNKKVEESFGIKGWHYGMLRANAFEKMMALLPEGIIVGHSDFDRYEEINDQVTVYFNNGQCVEADILIGADGIRSRVSSQVFGEPDLFHVGLRVWLAWCNPIDGVPKQQGVISHSDKYQASYFPMMHNGKPGYEWWVVEPVKENEPHPKDPKAYITDILKGWFDPLPRFPEVTGFDKQVFAWDIYNRPSLKKWSKGRVVCLGDAVHPVSPYAAYGMGMAIEDGYFLAKLLNHVDLSDDAAVANGFEKFEAERVDYVNHHVEFARELGRRFHHAPYPVAKVRDFIFDHTKVLQKMIAKDYLADAEKMSLSMTELHI
ncbi:MULTISPECIES: FAD-dependent oxidoreductase [Marinomonas]|uniref:FAD-dependent monooxygenase n=1 Tax=Marinomonas arctica TaxID=383750 RepID=A0A7H1J9M4_9GAMM|nr:MULTISPECIES: NAD(P)/FAD-dependent oxidoreductase [Marinomonas]MCS7485320.1 2-polyprenyl-6-methoxyphenol hydroxylase [Marinomonas sp. BSi20414]QNT07190.1 FAD-dependent monooxygenase [Marinomonas arctica]GGN24466.1 monooxygenase [Marinomonas arctica]